MKRLLFIGVALLWAQGLLAQAEVAFSHQGGFYEECFPLSLSCAGGHHIRFTVNGGIPTADATLYCEPLLLNEACYSNSNIYTIVNCIPSKFHSVPDVKHAIVIRAAAFDEFDSRVSPVVTQTYLIKSLGCDLHGLPVLSIAADSLDLFDYETGIFVPGVHYDLSDTTGSGNYNMTGREWERRINVEFYEPDNSGINQQCGLRTHGGASRWYQQKGMRLYAREEYGKKRFKHHFFETTPISSFKHLNLHPFRCSNWRHTGGQEYLSQCVAAQMDIDALGVRQTVVFINGEYWGIYTLEESPDERYLEDHYDVDLEQVNIIKYWGTLKYGHGSDWWQFRHWMESADLNQPADSAIAFSRMDVPNFIDYCIFELFGANLDWPQNNVLQWQAANGEPFRMIFYDGDGCFTRWYYKALDHAIHKEAASLIINRFFESDSFMKMFYERYAELKTTTFRYDNFMQIWNDYRDQVELEVPSQSERFGFPKSTKRWQADMDSTEFFFTHRFGAFDQELREMLFAGDDAIDRLEVYPNPNVGSFAVVLQVDKCAITPVQIFDVTGRCVHAEYCFLMAGENRIPISSDLQAGLYLLRVGNAMQRIIIQ